MADRHKIYSFNAAAEYLGISPRTLRTWIKEGKIKSFKMGHLVKIHGKDLKKFVNRGRHHDAPTDRKVRRRVILEIFHILDSSPDLARRVFQEDFPDEEVQAIAEKLAGWRDLSWQQALLTVAIKDLVYEIIEHTREDPDTRERYTRS
ncbi:MAG TPA: helix-turn-helix domain-containing protein [Methanomicrobiales archaeon]|nr:helix-turn-helix domain-containing protein [Methanomicrobiales archaeon]